MVSSGVVRVAARHRATRRDRIGEGEHGGSGGLKQKGVGHEAHAKKAN